MVVSSYVDGLTAAQVREKYPHFRVFTYKPFQNGLSNIRKKHNKEVAARANYDANGASCESFPSVIGRRLLFLLSDIFVVVVLLSSVRKDGYSRLKPQIIGGPLSAPEEEDEDDSTYQYSDRGDISFDDQCVYRGYWYTWCYFSPRTTASGAVSYVSARSTKTNKSIKSTRSESTKMRDHAKRSSDLVIATTNGGKSSAVTVSGGPLSPTTRARAKESLQLNKNKKQKTAHSVAGNKRNRGSSASVSSFKSSKTFKSQKSSSGRTVSTEKKRS